MYAPLEQQVLVYLFSSTVTVEYLYLNFPVN